MLSVYENFHETLKHARQGYHILQDLTGPEIEIFMKASKTENRFSTTKTQFAKYGINIPSSLQMERGNPLWFIIPPIKDTYSLRLCLHSEVFPQSTQVTLYVSIYVSTIDAWYF